MTGVHDRQDEMPARTCNQLNLGSVTATTNHGEADRFRLFGGFTFCRCLNFFGRHQQFTILPQALKEPLSGCWEPVLLPVKAIEGGPIVSPCLWNGRWLAPAYCPQTKRATASWYTANAKDLKTGHHLKGRRNFVHVRDKILSRTW